MSNEGSGNEDDAEEPDGWEPVEEPDAEGALDEREQDLKERERQLNKRERELEQREQEILERREENVEKREELENREEQLEQAKNELEDREQQLNEREQQLSERETEIESKREALEEYASEDRTFTSRPRIAGGILLWVVALASIVMAAWMYLDAGQPGGLAYLVEQSTATVAAAGLGLVAVIEILGGYWAYRGRRWSFVVFAAILGIIVLLPVGVTATIMITVGESQFD